MNERNLKTLKKKKKRNSHNVTHVYCKSMQGVLPWWRSGWEYICQCRGHGFEPLSGKIPHAVAQLSLCATTTEPAL